MKLKAFFKPVGNMEADEVRDYIETHREGTFTLLDVRQPKEYEKHRLSGAKLIPLPELTDRLGELEPDKPLIAY
ncbi:MAG: hypothetical protein U5R49_21600 [Deltaproteobacteria bacterium]|nr:hypothetical protein [Deltaproteobacteria bacterium]